MVIHFTRAKLEPARHNTGLQTKEGAVELAVAVIAKEVLVHDEFVLLKVRLMVRYSK